MSAPSDPGRDWESEPEPPAPDLQVEQDGRFPSGPWTGFFLQPLIPPGKHGMDLKLTFRAGKIRGEGFDKFGQFLIDGRYQVEDGQCWWSKQYISRHAVTYHGYNEGKGIWGQWRLPPQHGGFHVWPRAMGDPTLERLRRREDVPVEGEPALEEPVLVTAGSEEDGFGSLEP